MELDLETAKTILSSPLNILAIIGLFYLLKKLRAIDQKGLKMNTETLQESEGTDILKMPSKESILNNVLLLLSSSTILFAVLLIVMMVITKKIDTSLIVLTIIVFISGFTSAKIPYKKMLELQKDSAHSISNAIKWLVLGSFWAIGILIGVIVLSFIVYSFIK